MADKNIGKWVKYMALGSVISTTLAGLVVGGYLLGNFLDIRFGMDPLFKIVLILAGVFLGLGYIIMTLARLAKRNDEQ